MKIINAPPGGSGTPRVIVYGAPGVGKTQLALAFPSPVFLCTEEGLGARGAARFEGRLASFVEIDEALRVLFTERHDFKTVVLDSLDWAAPLIEAEAARRKGVNSIADQDFGRGYVWARDVWREVTGKLDCLRAQRQMSVVLIAHAATGEARDPGGEKYTSWGLALQKTSAAHLIEWADEVWFLSTAVAAERPDKRGRLGVAHGTDDRIVHTAPGVGYTAKSRSLEQTEYNCGADRSYAAILSEFFAQKEKA